MGIKNPTASLSAKQAIAIKDKLQGSVAA